jgi:hypothetical protein
MTAWAGPERPPSARGRQGRTSRARPERCRLVFARRPVVVAEDRRHRLDLETRELERLSQAAAVEHEPLAAVSPGIDPGESRRDQGKRAADGVEKDQVATTDLADGLERAERVAEHLQDIAHHDQVELTDFAWVEVVDAQVAILGAGAEQLCGDAECATSPRLSLLRSPTALACRGVLPLGIGEIDGDDFTCSTPFQLECPESIHRPDVEAPKAVHGRRPRHPVGGRPQVPPAGRDDTGRDFDHVPPGVARDRLSRCAGHPAILAVVRHRRP